MTQVSQALLSLAMPNTYRSHQGDSALPPLLRLVVEAVVPPGGAATPRVEVVPDGLAGIVVRVDGTTVESIDRLQQALGARPSWRRPVVSGAPVPEREALVSRRVSEGWTTSEIAAELGVSDRTVTTMRRRIRERSGSVDMDVGSLGVSVIGRQGVLRDVVHSCVSASRRDVNPAGVAHVDDRVRILVAPSVRDLAMGGAGRAVVIGALPDGVTLLDAVRQGMTALLPIEVTPNDLDQAIEAAMAGKARFESGVVQTLVDLLYDADADVAALTPRDLDVIDGIRRGESVKQTARRLGVSAKTVENRRHALYVRFGVNSAPELERAAGPVPRAEQL